MSACADCPYLSDMTPKRDRCCCDVVIKSTATPMPEPDISDTMMFRIPGRSAARGEITHKKFSGMNRKERRAFLSARNR